MLLTTFIAVGLIWTTLSAIYTARKLKAQGTTIPEAGVVLQLLQLAAMLWIALILLMMQAGILV